MIVKRKVISDPEVLKHQFKGLSTRGALICLQQKYGKGNMTFIWHSQTCTVNGLLEEVPDYLLDMRCGEFGVVRFYGGPPAQGRWFDGTVLTMLCDAALFDNRTKDMPVSQLLGL
jgi:hypothetical protein